MCGGGGTGAPGSPKTNKPDNFCWQHCLKKEKKVAQQMSVVVFISAVFLRSCMDLISKRAYPNKVLKSFSDAW